MLVLMRFGLVQKRRQRWSGEGGILAPSRSSGSDAVGLPPCLRKRNWMRRSGSEGSVALSWEARWVMVVKGWSSRMDDSA